MSVPYVYGYGYGYPPTVAAPVSKSWRSWIIVVVVVLVLVVIIFLIVLFWPSGDTPPGPPPRRQGMDPRQLNGQTPIEDWIYRGQAYITTSGDQTNVTHNRFNDIINKIVIWENTAWLNIITIQASSNRAGDGVVMPGCVSSAPWGSQADNLTLSVNNASFNRRGYAFGMGSNLSQTDQVKNSFPVFCPCAQPGSLALTTPSAMYGPFKGDSRSVTTVPLDQYSNQGFMACSPATCDWNWNNGRGWETDGTRISFIQASQGKIFQGRTIFKSSPVRVSYIEPARAAQWRVGLPFPVDDALDTYGFCYWFINGQWESTWPVF